MQPVKFDNIKDRPTVSSETVNWLSMLVENICFIIFYLFLNSKVKHLSVKFLMKSYITHNAVQTFHQKGGGLFI